MRQFRRIRAIRVDHPDRRSVLRAIPPRRGVGMLVRLIGDPHAVERPCRLGPFGDDLFRRAAARRDDPDSAVPVRVIGEKLSVRRPRRLHVLAAVASERHLRRRSVERAHVDLERAGAIRHEGDRVALRRQGRLLVQAAVRGELDRPFDAVLAAGALAARGAVSFPGQQAENDGHRSQGRRHI